MCGILSITTGEDRIQIAIVKLEFYQLLLLLLWDRSDFLWLNFARKFKSYKLYLQNGTEIIILYINLPFHLLARLKYHCTDHNHSNWKQKKPTTTTAPATITSIEILTAINTNERRRSYRFSNVSNLCSQYIQLLLLLLLQH